MSDPRTDTELLEAYRSGDDDALSVLLARHAAAVQRFGVKMCRDPEDAKDVLQDTLLAAARGAREFRGASSLSTWLYTIARSFCIKKRRGLAANRTEALDEDAVMELAAHEKTPDEIAADQEIGIALEESIRALAPMYREVLLLRDVEGLSAAEVAQVIGIGVDAVKSRLHRARVAVRNRMAPLVTPDEAGPRPGCPDVVRMLSRYLEGEIGKDQCKELDDHVASCARCRADCDSLRRILTLCERERSTEAPGVDVAAAVRAAIAR